ncbi:hypothetical protein UlMin_036649 [Ulmus minor]
MKKSCETWIKVTVNCEICKQNIFKAISKLTGIDQAQVNAEKGTLAVIGDVDPTLIVKQVRKTGKVAVIESVGPPKKKPPEPKKPTDPLPLCCHSCRVVVFSFDSYDGGRCNIL